MQDPTRAERIKKCIEAMARANRGKSRSFKIRERIRKTLFGKKHSPERIEANRNGHVGLKASLSTRLKMSQKRKGSDNPSWRGGITPLNYKIRNSLEYQLWREKVFKRDDYTCQFCGQIGGNLIVDHIKPFSLFPKLRFNVDNGRVLCRDCHRKTDTFSGKVQNYARG